MRRYRYLEKEQVFEALNKLRAAFLAAKDGSDVDQIIKGVLTSDERIKIGRRIIISQLLDTEMTYDEISKNYKIGKQTVLQIQKLKDKYPNCFELINNREKKVDDEYNKKAYEKVGYIRSLQRFPNYTGFKRRDVKR